MNSAEEGARPDRPCQWPGDVQESGLAILISFECNANVFDYPKHLFKSAMFVSVAVLEIREDSFVLKD